MKKRLSILFIITLVTTSLLINGYLFLRINHLESKILVETIASNNSSFNNEVRPIVHNVTSNTTQVVENVSDKVVAIQVYLNNNLYSSGSGVIYKADGNEVYIATNHHVIDGGDRFIIVFNSGKSLEVELIGSDKYTDLALLKFNDYIGVEAIDLGNSDLLKVGEEVIAIGSPLGLAYAGTTTKGIISGTNRIVSVDIDGDSIDDWDMNVIQTDAAINTGNSGGALINMAGELIGITSMKLTGESVEGIGFAIPVNDIRAVLDEIMHNGSISRPVLGISSLSIDTISNYERYLYQIDSTRLNGVYVYLVQEGSAADIAGIEIGDIIVTFAGQKITTYKAFVQVLYSKSSGDQVQIEIERAEEIIRLEVVLG